MGFFIGKQGEYIKRIQAQRAPRQRHAVTHSSLFSFLSAGTDGCHCGREPKHCGGQVCMPLAHGGGQVIDQETKDYGCASRRCHDVSCRRLH